MENGAHFKVGRVICPLPAADALRRQHGVVGQGVRALLPVTYPHHHPLRLASSAAEMAVPKGGWLFIIHRFFAMEFG